MDSYEIVDTELFKIKMFLQLTATIWRPHDAVSRQVVVLSWENILIFQFSLSIFELGYSKRRNYSVSKKEFIDIWYFDFMFTITSFRVDIVNKNNHYTVPEICSFVFIQI